jgi:outer membrane scaffolding protein for murein synthesis (MipA/OmpV family)
MITVLPTSVQAAEIQTDSTPEFSRSGSESEEKDWNFELGVGLMYGPKYDGSDNYGFQPIPQLSVEYKNGLFFASIFDGIGSYFLQGDSYKVGTAIGPSFGRDEDDDKENLRGMGDIDTAVVVDLMGEYDFGPFQLSGKVSKGAGDYGSTASIDFGTRFPMTESLMIMASIGSTWADDEHMQTYFGVSPQQSERSGYSRHDAKSGIKSVGFSVGAIYNLSERWGVMMMFNCDKLLSDAESSPITKEDIQPSIILTTSFNF